MLEVKNISKAFGGVNAVSDFSMYVDDCEIVGIIGPNGAGKTTALNLISGITPLDTGSVILNGTHLEKMAMHDVPI